MAQRRISELQKRQMQDLRVRGVPVVEVARQLGVGRSTVYLYTDPRLNRAYERSSPR